VQLFSIFCKGSLSYFLYIIRIKILFIIFESILRFVSLINFVYKFDNNEYNRYYLGMNKIN
jgi:hypothetical protein